MNIVDTLTDLRDESEPGSGAWSAYNDAISLIESIENLNTLNWKLTQARDDAEEADYAPAFRASYLDALENAQRIVLELRIDDE